MDAQFHDKDTRRINMRFLNVLIVISLFPCLLRGQMNPFYFQQVLPDRDSLEKILRNTKDEFTIINTNREIGFLYYENKRDSAMFYFEKCLLLAKKANRKLWEADACNSIGFICYTQGNYPRALQFILQSKKIAEDPESEKNAWPSSEKYSVTPSVARQEILSRCLNHFASIYGYTGNFKDYAELELQHFNEALRIAVSLNNKFLQSIINMNLARHYYFANVPDSVFYYENKALEFVEQTGYTRYKGSMFTTIGNTYARQKDYAHAKESFYLGLKASRDIKNLRSLADGYLAMSNMYRELAETDSSIYFGKKALETYDITLIPSGMADAYTSISRTYQLMNNIDSAFKYQGLAMKAREVLSAEDKIKQFQNMNFDERLRVQQAEEEKSRLNNRIRTYALLTGIVVFMLIAFILLRNNRSRRKANMLLEEQKSELQQTLVELKSAQAQLIQSEKMASLGELTAGIAHEIQNPLNFVNNFSEVSNELIDEMSEDLNKGDIDGARAIANEVKQNLEKINHHGKRADGIVKGMLQHSQNSGGVKEEIDINGLADEYLRLAYHGLRAKDKSFNAALKTDFDRNVGKIKVIPQEIGRVILNLINNAFYAVGERHKANGLGYEPTVSISTKKVNDKVEIRVTDNGNGIAPKVVDKIFQPFFTTKPTGQGTGLGLSLSYDIVKAHGGEIKVETNVGEGSQFVIQLPAV